MKKYKVGYTQGAFDMFHIGHLNLLKRAKEQCDVLIVGINSDNLVYEYKNKKTIISEKERAEIVSSIKYVDDVLIINTLDKLHIWENVRFDAIFIGSDWEGNLRWKQTEKDMQTKGVEVVYLEYTQGISSSIIRNRFENNNGG